jgi:putative PIN family toxin of toxin-antitoxin system
VKAVFDTNVLIAAFVSEGLCTKLLIRARKKDFQLILCPYILDEFGDVLHRKFSASARETKNARDLIIEASEIIIIPHKSINGVCRDPQGDHILACAMSAKTDYLVTGDNDLLVLGQFGGVKIVTHKAFEMLFV